MPEIVKTMKLHLAVSDADKAKLAEIADKYASVCTYISKYMFDNGFELNSRKLQDKLYHTIRDEFGLKSQFTISAIKTVIARYKAEATKLESKPYRYQDESGKWVAVPKTLDWLWYPIEFKRPQADFVRGRDYSFIEDRTTYKLSLNTLEKRIKVGFDVPDNFKEYFDGTWKFGTGKIVSLLGEWYFHIPMTKVIGKEFQSDMPKHVVGIDRGLRFLATAYDEKGKTTFIDGKDILAKRDKFQKVRSELQAKGTKSAKRALKRISGRENRWMSDVNHSITKTLVQKYGSDTLFVLEDLTGVSFSDDILSNRSKKDRQSIRTWAFYQFEQDLTYKAQEVGSAVIKVDPMYTSQRCPKCGRIHKENRKHETHEYICDCCGYRSNDDRIGAMNIQMLGTMYVSGVDNPKITIRKAAKSKAKAKKAG